MEEVNGAQENDTQENGTQMTLIKADLHGFQITMKSFGNEYPPQGCKMPPNESALIRTHQRHLRTVLHR